MERLSTFPHAAFTATEEMDPEESTSSTIDTTADLAFQQEESDLTAPLTELQNLDEDLYADQQGTTLQDALHQVPQLLHTCVSNSVVGLRGMRLVCKETSANTSAIKEARRYCIRLSCQPSIFEPLQQVAELLQHSRLESLRVEVSVQSGWCGSKVLSLFCLTWLQLCQASGVVRRETGAKFMAATALQRYFLIFWACVELFLNVIIHVLNCWNGVHHSKSYVYRDLLLG